MLTIISPCCSCCSKKIVNLKEFVSGTALLYKKGHWAKDATTN